MLRERAEMGAHYCCRSKGKFENLQLAEELAVAASWLATARGLASRSGLGSSSSRA